MKNNSPIFVTGVERSGSSLVTRVLEIAGAYVGPTTVMKENLNIKKVVDDYYDKQGLCPFGQYPLPNVDELSIPNNWRTKVEVGLMSEGLDVENQKWMYKTNRLCQIWPVWNHAFPNAKWIVVRRRTGDIVESCLKTGFMRAFKGLDARRKINVETEEDGWKWWVRWHEKRFVEIIEAGLNCKIIWPERMIQGDYSQMYETLEWVGLPWKDEIINKIDPVLWKSRKKYAEI